MIPQKWLGISAVIALLSACALSGGVNDTDIGLSKTSVFDAPDPEVFVYDDTRARYSKSLARAFPGAPPQVPHEMESMLPITLEDNQCLECHDRPDEIGEEKVKGGNPMDKQHYASIGESGSEDGWSLSGMRFTCNQCPVAVAYEDRFIDFVKKYKEKGVKFVAINVNTTEDLGAMKQRLLTSSSAQQRPMVCRRRWSSIRVAPILPGLRTSIFY